MNKKKLIALSLVSSMAIVPGCGKKETVSSTSDLKKGVVEYPLKESEKLTYWCNLPMQVSSSVSNYGETPFAKVLEEATGIKVEYIHPTQGQANALNLLIASGNMPDIVQGYWYGQEPANCIQQGVICNLNDYIDDYAPNFKKYLEENKDIDKMISTDEGYKYVFPFIREDDTTCAVAGFMLRSDWLKELGLEIPETIDEWDNVLAAFKTKCEIPLAVSDYRFFAGGFDAFYCEYIDNGKVKYGPVEENFKNFLSKMHEWYTKGYIDPNFSIADGKIIDSNMLNGVSGITMGAGGSKMGVYLSSMRGKQFDLSAAPFPSAKKGEKSKYSANQQRYTEMGCAVSKNSKVPELAVRYLDYGYSKEGNMLYNFGKEGVSYNMVDGYPTYNKDYFDISDGKSVAEKLTMNCLGAESGPFVQDRRYLEQYYGTPQQNDAIKKWSDNIFKKYRLPMVMLTAEESTEYSSIMTEIETYVDETVVAMIIGKKPISDFDEFVSTVKSMNLDRALEIKQASYERYNKR